MCFCFTCKFNSRVKGVPESGGEDGVARPAKEELRSGTRTTPPRQGQTRPSALPLGTLHFTRAGPVSAGLRAI